MYPNNYNQQQQGNGNGFGHGNVFGNGINHGPQLVLDGAPQQPNLNNHNGYNNYNDNNYAAFNNNDGYDNNNHHHQNNNHHHQNNNYGHNNFQNNLNNNHHNNNHGYNHDYNNHHHQNNNYGYNNIRNNHNGYNNNNNRQQQPQQQQQQQHQENNFYHLPNEFNVHLVAPQPQQQLYYNNDVYDGILKVGGVVAILLAGGVAVYLCSDLLIAILTAITNPFFICAVVGLFLVYRFPNELKACVNSITGTIFHLHNYLATIFPPYNFIINNKEKIFFSGIAIVFCLIFLLSNGIDVIGIVSSYFTKRSLTKAGTIVSSSTNNFVVSICNDLFGFFSFIIKLTGIVLICAVFFLVLFIVYKIFNYFKNNNNANNNNNAYERARAISISLARSDEGIQQQNHQQQQEENEDQEEEQNQPQEEEQEEEEEENNENQPEQQQVQEQQQQQQPFQEDPETRASTPLPRFGFMVKNNNNNNDNDKVDEN